MDDNYSPALTDHRLHFIEWRVENEKIGGILSPTAASLPSQHTGEKKKKMHQQSLMLH